MKRIIPLLLICSHAFGIYLVRLDKPSDVIVDTGEEYLTYSNGADIIHYDDAYWNGTTWYMKEAIAEHEFIYGSVKSNVNALISSIALGNTDLNLYTTQDHANTNYVRNTSCWANTLDMTCASPWNEVGDGALASQTGIPSGQFRALTLIAPDIVIGCRHYYPDDDNPMWDSPPYNDFEVRFVDSDNNVYSANATNHFILASSSADITNYLSSWVWNDYGDPTNFPGDAILFKLDTEIDSSIKPAYCLPEDWKDYFPMNRIGISPYPYTLWGYPLVSTDREERATISESWYYGFYGTRNTCDLTTLYGPIYCSTNYNNFAIRRNTFKDHYRDKVNGDSSSPMFLFPDADSPVLLFPIFKAGGGTGYMLHCQYDDIQAGIVALGSTNVFQRIDLSGYKTFD